MTAPCVIASASPRNSEYVPRVTINGGSRSYVGKLAQELGEDQDVLLAMAGKISADLRAIILSRPKLFADLIRSVKSMPDKAVLKIVREVRDGEW